MTEARITQYPATSSVDLIKYIDGEPRKEQCNYRAIIGMMNYLVNCTHPDLSFVVHQCAHSAMIQREPTIKQLNEFSDTSSVLKHSMQETSNLRKVFYSNQIK